MPSRVGLIGALASPKLPARQGISSFRHAHTIKITGGSRPRNANDVRRRQTATVSRETVAREEVVLEPAVLVEFRLRMLNGPAGQTCFVRSVC